MALWHKTVHRRKKGRNMILITACLFSFGSVSAAAPFSPVNSLESSLAASAAHGTVVAVTTRYSAIDATTNTTEDVPCVVLVSHSSSSLEDDDEVDTASTTDRGWSSAAPALPEGPLRTGTNLHVLRHGGVAAGVTGFAPDVRHLLRSVARAQSDHEQLYGDDVRLGHVKRDVVDVLAARVSAAARADAGRPFGVHALIVGRSGDGPALYDVDPAGAWRCWGGGATAVGRGAERVRRRLWETLAPGDDPEEERATVTSTLSESVEDAVRLCLTALNGSEEDDDELTLTCNQLDAMVVLGTKCIEVDPGLLQEAYRKCFPTAGTEKTSS